MRLVRRAECGSARCARCARCIGLDGEVCEAALDELERLATAAGSTAGPVQLGARRAWVKASPLRGRSRLRHGLRGALLRRPLPREAEHANLRWLERRLFRVPPPLAAAALHRGGLPAHQALFTGFVEDAAPLPQVLDGATAREREELLEELAREVGRMHALGFAHRDLYLRNVLVTPPAPRGDPRRLVVIDAWSGGPGRARRDAPLDLACLLLEGANLLLPGEQRLLLARYLDERALQEAPAGRARLLARASVARAGLLRRIAREPGRWRLSEPPRDWALD